MVPDTRSTRRWRRGSPAGSASRPRRSGAAGRRSRRGGQALSEQKIAIDAPQPLETPAVERLDGSQVLLADRVRELIVVPQVADGRREEWAEPQRLLEVVLDEDLELPGSVHGLVAVIQPGNQRDLRSASLASCRARAS